MSAKKLCSETLCLNEAVVFDPRHLCAQCQQANGSAAAPALNKPPPAGDNAPHGRPNPRKGA